jgi:RNA polymerase sigma factor (TIGR02999 family)
MNEQKPSDVTAVLGELHAGDLDAQNRLLEIVYDELREMAAGFLLAERPGHTLQPTAVVHEFVLRLHGTELEALDRRSFFKFATVVMRHVLAEHGRRRAAQKRGHGCARVPLDDVADYFDRQRLDVQAVNEALAGLALLEPRQSEAVTLHYFGGFTVTEIAEQLKVSVSTAESDLRIARAWLRRQLGGTDP